MVLYGKFKQLFKLQMKHIKIRYLFWHLQCLVMNKDSLILIYLFQYIFILIKIFERFRIAIVMDQYDEMMAKLLPQLQEKKIRHTDPLVKQVTHCAC